MSLIAGSWRLVAVMVARLVRSPKAHAAIPIVAGLLFASCQGGVSPTPVTTSQIIRVERGAHTTTTTQMETLALQGAPNGWKRVVASAYGKSCNGDRSLVPPEIAALDEAKMCPAGGLTSTASLDQWTLAVSTIGDDVMYGVGGTAGWNLVAARVPSLGQTAGWYGLVPKIVAVVGSDARPGQDPTSARADSIHLLALDGQGNGGILGLPRDSWVTMSGGGKNKVNASLSMGGPDVMMKTLTDVTGLTFDGYVLTGFTGFEEMVGNVLGGVDIYLPAPVIDSASGANLSAGSQYLNGPQALALARARKSLSNGDITRSLNGGTILLAALGSVQAYGPRHLPHLIEEGAQWITTDLSLHELLAFSALAFDTPLEAIGNAVAPGRVGWAGTASVVYLSDEAPQFFADLADGDLAP